MRGCISVPHANNDDSTIDHYDPERDLSVPLCKQLLWLHADRFPYPWMPFYHPTIERMGFSALAGDRLLTSTNFA